MRRHSQASGFNPRTAVQSRLESRGRDDTWNTNRMASDALVSGHALLKTECSELKCESFQIRTGRTCRRSAAVSWFWSNSSGYNPRLSHVVLIPLVQIKVSLICILLKFHKGTGNLCSNSVVSIPGIRHVVDRVEVICKLDLVQFVILTILGVGKIPKEFANVFLNILFG